MKLRRVTQDDWPVSTYAEDGVRKNRLPTKDEGDGHTYFVRNIFGQFVVQLLGDPSKPEGMWLGFSDSERRAYPFYDGQAAWGVASRSIYPAEVLILVEEEKEQGREDAAR